MLAALIYFYRNHLSKNLAHNLDPLYSISTTSGMLMNFIIQFLLDHISIWLICFGKKG